LTQDVARSEIEKIGRECLCLHARMTSRAITRHYNAYFVPLGLEATEFSLLAALKYGTEGSIAELAERLAFERTTLVRNLKRLAERQLIAPVGGAGRAVNYRLTEHGQRLLQEALPLWSRAQAAVHESLNELEASTVLSSLKKLRRAASK
jgi:DNA-binding MarR family transcriptional regulator